MCKWRSRTEVRTAVGRTHYERRAIESLDTGVVVLRLPIGEVRTDELCLDEGFSTSFPAPELFKLSSS